jgi:hypothetical protein
MRIILLMKRIQYTVICEGNPDFRKILPLFAVIRIGSTHTPASIRPDLYLHTERKKTKRGKGGIHCGCFS